MPKSAVRIYNRIKAVIAEKRRTSIWVAKKTGVSVQSVSRWCRNVSQPEIENLFKIADALDVDAGDLLLRRNDMVLLKKVTVYPKSKTKTQVKRKRKAKIKRRP